jgi:hypothetical protein
MFENNGHIEDAKANYELFCDIEMLLGLACILPCLETMQGLSKFLEEKDTIICDFIYALKLAKVNLITMYCNNEKSYNPQDFLLFLELVENINDVLCLT